jgi:ABC-type sugar transport system ATPase subunit
MEVAPQAALEAIGIGKRFGGVQALLDVDLTLAPSEIHAVIGENGAGKSTLMRIASGLEAPDAGSVVVGGVPLDPSPQAARQAGVALVHQELSLVPTLSVAENICLGDLPSRGGAVRWGAVKREARAAMGRLDFNIDADELVTRLSLAQRQFVEIAKALRQDPRILILDEPTAALTPPETSELIALVKRAAAHGTSILFVSHRIPEIFELCSTATVLRDGRKVADLELARSTPDEVVQLMVGRNLEVAARRAPRADAPVLLRLTDIEAPRVDKVSFDLLAGEIVGIGGLVGAGRSEMIRAAIRLDHLLGGTTELDIDGKMVPLTSYRHAISNGIAFVPEERRFEGLAAMLSISENIALPSAPELSRRGLVRRRRIRGLGREAVSRYAIRARSEATITGHLSGGNQQKVVLAKWLIRKIRVLVLDEPTRGVDVGAKAEVHAIVRAAADQGLGVLVVSSDLPELIDIADRIIVMKDGRVTGEVEGDEATEETVMRLATRDRAE